MSWVVYDKDGKPAFETFNSRTASAYKAEGYKVKTVLEHLQELNREIRERDERNKT